ALRTTIFLKSAPSIVELIISACPFCKLTPVFKACSAYFSNVSFSIIFQPPFVCLIAMSLLFHIYPRITKKQYSIPRYVSRFTYFDPMERPCQKWSPYHVIAYDVLYDVLLFPRPRHVVAFPLLSLDRQAERLLASPTHRQQQMLKRRLHTLCAHP